jgi:uncharacterized protein YhbP (UPF0306 family)
LTPDSSLPALKKLASQILERGYLMSLATVDDSGPWVSDVIYVFDDELSIYWLSKTGTRHSKAIAANRTVAATVTLTAGKDEEEAGLQIEGTAVAVEGDILALATQHRLKRGKPAPKNEGEILDPGESWYCLKPSKIEVIYGPYWGFRKQVLEFTQ